MNEWCYTFSVTVLSSDNAFFLEMWTVQLPEILKLCNWKWEYDCDFAMHNMNEWTLSSRFVYVAYIDVLFSPHSNDVMSCQSSSEENIFSRKYSHYFITKVWKCNILCFPFIRMIWRYYKVVCDGRSRATSRHPTMCTI